MSDDVKVCSTCGGELYSLEKSQGHHDDSGDCVNGLLRVVDKLEARIRELEGQLATREEQERRDGEERL